MKEYDDNVNKWSGLGIKWGKLEVYFSVLVVSCCLVLVNCWYVEMCFDIVKFFGF